MSRVAGQGDSLTITTPVSQFAGVVLRDGDTSAAVELLHTAAKAGTPTAVHLCNAYTLALAARRPAYRRVLGHRSINLPDGTPVVWFARLQTRRPQSGPVRGPSLMRAALSQPGFMHFFLGGSPEVLSKLSHEAVRLCPDVRLVGGLAPGFGPVSSADISTFAEAIIDSGANIVWVGLGTPKQDEVIAALVDQVDAVLVGVGAAFDFLSHNKKEAPAFLHGTGLEWLYRLVCEPRRLWRRYLIGNAQFAYYALVSLRRSRRADVSVG
jgi:N-acetylglucosaminyldiphosphoundecaprenol N-acetyl-beta-D-mannosaminyltransferase